MYFVDFEFQASEDLLQKHYEQLADRPFYPGLIKYMASGPVVPMVWEGEGIVKTGRVMLGETDPARSAPGTIRGDFCVIPGRNLIHGSDSVQAAVKEIGLWFKDDELTVWTQSLDSWINESNWIIYYFYWERELQFPAFFTTVAPKSFGSRSLRNDFLSVF